MHKALNTVLDMRQRQNARWLNLRDLFTTAFCYRTIAPPYFALGTRRRMLQRLFTSWTIRAVVGAVGRCPWH